MRTCCLECFLVAQHEDSPQGKIAREARQREQQYRQHSQQENKKEVQKLRESIEDELIRQQFSHIAPLSPIGMPMAMSTPNATCLAYPDLYRTMANATAPGLQPFNLRNTPV